MSQTDDNKTPDKLTPEEARLKRAEHFAEMRSRKQVIVGLILVINFLIFVGGPICVYYVRQANKLQDDVKDCKSASATLAIQINRDADVRIEKMRQEYDRKQQEFYDREYAKWADRESDLDEALKINRQMKMTQRAAKVEVRQATNKVKAIIHESAPNN